MGRDRTPAGGGAHSRWIRFLLTSLAGSTCLVILLAFYPSSLFSQHVPGAILVDEHFSEANATASWRWGAGKWTVSNGFLVGTETPERKHPAGIACQRKYRDADIRFRFQFAGGNVAMLLLRNAWGNLCRVTLTTNSCTITRDRPNLPATNREKAVLLGKMDAKLLPNQWYSVEAVVQGTNFRATLPGFGTMSGSHPGLDVDKTEIEFLAGGASVWFDDLVARVPGPTAR